MKPLSFIEPLLIIVLSCTASLAYADEASPTPSASPEKTADRAVDDALRKLQENQRVIDSKTSELKKIDNQIEELSQKHQSATNQAELAAGQLSRITSQLRKTELQLEQTHLTVNIIEQQISATKQNIADIELEINSKRDQMKSNIISIYQYQETSFLDILLGSQSLGEMLSEQHTYNLLQEQALKLVAELKEIQTQQHQHQQDLIQQRRDLQQVQQSQQYLRQNLGQQSQAKKDFLKLKRDEQVAYANQIAETRQARSEIEQQLFKLKSTGLEIALNDAFASARFASSLTKVRPALLLGIIKVETNVGANVGSGKFPDDMHPASRDAFIRVTQKLGLDPYHVPVSRRPTTYQGWGGAIGPAQFMPDTWERIEGRVASLISKPIPDPFDLTDALVAVGVMLADRGAVDPAQETEAVARYLAGPNWQYHLWYSSRVLAVAAEYEKEGLR